MVEADRIVHVAAAAHSAGLAKLLAKSRRSFPIAGGDCFSQPLRVDCLACPVASLVGLNRSDRHVGFDVPEHAVTWRRMTTAENAIAGCEIFAAKRRWESRSLAGAAPR